MAFLKWRMWLRQDLGRIRKENKRKVKPKIKATTGLKAWPIHERLQSRATQWAINLQSRQKLRICEMATATATICLILMGMLIEPLACQPSATGLVSQHLAPNWPMDQQPNGPTDGFGGPVCASRLLIYVRPKLFGSLNTSKC